jgi:outer membrane autotransporter protein
MERRTLAEFLFATTSVAALLLATGVQPAHAVVPCSSNTVGNTSSPTVNSGAIACIAITGSAVSLTNTASGKIGPSTTPGTPVLISGGATLSGGVLNAGTITASGTSDFFESMDIDGFVGGTVSNSGTITATAASGVSTATAIGIHIGNTLLGGLVNSGTIAASASSTGAGDCAHAYAITIDNDLLIGGISNSGTVTASAISSGSSAAAYGLTGFSSVFDGPIVNTGTIAATASAANFAGAYAITYSGTVFSGGLTNSGTISGTATSSAAEASATGVSLGFSTFVGNVSNSGTVSAVATGPTGASAIALSVFGETLFQGTVTNSGTISARATTSGTGEAEATGVGLGAGTFFSGSFINSGMVSATATATGTGETLATGVEQSLFSYGSGGNNFSFANSGSISASAAGVSGLTEATGVDLLDYSGGGSLSFVNSGTLSATATSATGEAEAIGVVMSYDSGSAVITASSPSQGLINNTGTISASASLSGVASTGAFAAGLELDARTAFGNIINSGTISASARMIGTNTAFNCAEANATGALISAGLLIGNITNSGTISATATSTATSAGCNCAVANGLSIGIDTMTGTVANSGTISASATQNSSRGCACAVALNVSIGTITGNLVNSGTLTAVATGQAGCARALWLDDFGSTITGNVTNGGAITARFTAPSTGFGSATGVRVDVGTFNGALVNSGTITATRSGPGCAYGIRVSELNSGNFTIANSGTISATDVGVELNGSSVPVTINQTAGLITGTTAIAFSANGDTLNASGGKIAGNLVGQAGGTMATINVAAGVGGTFTYAGTTTNIGTINVNSGTLLLATQASGAASVVNTVTFTQGAGGTLGLGAMPTTISSVTASGALSLAGPLVVYEGAAGWKPGTTYTYADALVGGSLTGAFSSVGSYSPLFTAGAAQAGNSETVTLGLLPLGSVPGLSGNDRSVLGALETLLANPNTPASVVNTLGQIYTLNSTSAVGSFATSLSGEQNTQNFQFSQSAWGQFTDMLLDRLFGDGGGGTTGVASFSKDQGVQFAQADIPQVAQASDAARPGVAPAARPSKWGVWARGYGSWASAPSTASSASYDESGAGVILGGDAQITSNLVGGFAFNIGSDTADISGGSRNNINTYQGALYGKYAVDPHIYVAGLAGFGWQDYDSRRFIVAPISANATANYSGQGYRLYGESGYALHLSGPMPDTTVTPYVGLGYLRTHVDGFTEAGGGGAALAVGAVDANSFTTSLGARASTSLRVGNMLLKPEVRAAWQHEWLDDSTNVQSAFASAPGSVFTVTGAGFGRDSFIGGTGVSTTLAGFGVNDPHFASTQLYFDYDVKANGGYLSNVVSGGFRMKF